MHVVDRLARTDLFLDAADRRERVRLDVRRVLPDGDNRVLLLNRDAGCGPELLPAYVRDGEDRGLAGLLQWNLGRVDGGDRVGLGRRVLAAELGSVTSESAGARKGPCAWSLGVGAT